MAQKKPEPKPEPEPEIPVPNIPPLPEPETPPKEKERRRKRDDCAHPIHFSFPKKGKVRLTVDRSPSTVNINEKKHNEMATRTGEQLTRIANTYLCRGLPQNCETIFCLQALARNTDYGSQIDRATRLDERAYEEMVTEALLDLKSQGEGQNVFFTSETMEWGLIVGFDIKTGMLTNKYTVHGWVSRSGPNLHFRDVGLFPGAGA